MLLHLRDEREETDPVERDKPEKETEGEGKQNAEGPYSGPTRLEANLGFRESRREIRNGIKSYGRKRRT